jgi:hypothetical protein
MTAQQPDGYSTRFSGYDLTTLRAMVARGDAAYDGGAHCWHIWPPAAPEGLPIVVPDVDWRAAVAAMKAAATPPERRPLVFARAVTPAVTVGLDDSLTLVMQVPGDVTRLTISDGDALNDAVGEARLIRHQIEAEQATYAEQYGPAADAEAGL